MTATEVLERAAQTARLLGATYGRLQAELLTPLVARCLAHPAPARRDPAACCSTGARRALRYASPLARVQGRADAANTLLFLQAVARAWAARRRRRSMPPRRRAGSARTLGAPAEMPAAPLPPNPSQE